MKDQVILKNRVKELRARLNLRQSDLAREVEVTRQTILAIEKRRLNPSILVSLKIARVLREPLNYVFYLHEVPPPEAAWETAGAPPHSPPDDNKSGPRAIFDFS